MNNKILLGKLSNLFAKAKVRATEQALDRLEELEDFLQGPNEYTVREELTLLEEMQADLNRALAAIVTFNKATIEMAYEGSSLFLENKGQTWEAFRKAHLGNDTKAMKANLLQEVEQIS